MAPTTALDKLQICFTGRCLAFTRAEASRLVASHGGTVTPHVTRETDLLVIGSMGWPLQRNGRLTRNLEDARRLQEGAARLRIESEETFLRRLCDDGEVASSRYSLPELSALLSVSPQRLLYWFSAGLISPVEVRSGLSFFSYSDVARCRTLCELSSGGVNGQRLVRALRQLQVWVPDISEVLDRLSIEGGQLAVRDVNGYRLQTDGQFLFDFGCENGTGTTLVADLEAFFAEAVAQEHAGNCVEAAETYQRLLEHAPHDSDALYNLGNVYEKLSQPLRAVSCYRKAIEEDPEFVEAWHNLGETLAEMSQPDDAYAAYQTAYQLDPTYLPSLFGLAKALCDSGRADAAIPYWYAYLQRQPQGECADFARRCLRRKTPLRS